jgi:hypothetical protein
LTVFRVAISFASRGIENAQHFPATLSVGPKGRSDLLRFFRLRNATEPNLRALRCVAASSSTSDDARCNVLRACPELLRDVPPEKRRCYFGRLARRGDVEGLSEAGEAIGKEEVSSALSAACAAPAYAIVSPMAEWGIHGAHEDGVRFVEFALTHEAGLRRLAQLTADWHWAAGQGDAVDRRHTPEEIIIRGAYEFFPCEHAHYALLKLSP